ncbi:hypothetical protein C2G38_2078597 [Gigaspora rosea]|uniref:Uncharacterized protein n=1 Tax=Gigaspora rosea TaxID=44941 RepID=A0A397VJZ3_9GLOM|nr:hypothetical protein C2G38_2078597 [Gigaspora rosea]
MPLYIKFLNQTRMRLCLFFTLVKQSKTKLHVFKIEIHDSKMAKRKYMIQKHGLDSKIEIHDSKMEIHDSKIEIHDLKKNSYLLLMRC